MMMATVSNPGKPTMLLIAGFGDNASMFDGLLNTELSETFELLPLDLPGFGRTAKLTETTLNSLADFVVERAKETGATSITAHSVASIIASLAASCSGCSLRTIISLEGNLTAEDAYFSGTALDYENPTQFRSAFLNRLSQMALAKPEIERYREEVAKADEHALWQLGCDARRFSEQYHPGQILADAGDSIYLYNPENCPKTTLAWLDANSLPRLLLENASHWPSVDQPDRLASKISEAFEIVGQTD